MSRRSLFSRMDCSGCVIFLKRMQSNSARSAESHRPVRRSVYSSNCRSICGRMLSSIRPQRQTPGRWSCTRFCWITGAPGSSTGCGGRICPWRRRPRSSREKFVDEPGLPLQIDRIMPASKDTIRAIFIILFYLALLCCLLLFANHIRPHP